MEKQEVVYNDADIGAQKEALAYYKQTVVWQQCHKKNNLLKNKRKEEVFCA